MLYISLYIISSFLFIYIGNQYLDKKHFDVWWIIIVSFLWPFALLWLFAFEWDKIFKRKKKPRDVVPWTCGGYLWWEVVEARWSKGIVIDYSGENLIKVLWMNSSVSEFIDVSEITSTQKPSELVEELAMYDQANKLLEKADAIVKEAGELKMKAVKKRTNLIANL